MASRKFEGLDESTGLLAGEYSGKATVQMHGIHYEFDLQTGHKTGLYLDQQVNYRRVEQILKERPGGRVLDCFCFLGGFTLHAARAGAAHVTGLDQSPAAIDAARKNADLNGLGSRCSFEVVNIFDWLKNASSAAGRPKVVPQFDAIILDPPSFTRNRSAIPDALRGYKEIHLRALKLIKPGGLLFSFCCSHHISGTLFQEVILEAARDTNRLLRRLEIFTQSPDHPVVISIPETEYLKGYVFEAN